MVALDSYLYLVTAALKIGLTPNRTGETTTQPKIEVEAIEIFSLKRKEANCPIKNQHHVEVLLVEGTQAEELTHLAYILVEVLMQEEALNLAYVEIVAWDKLVASMPFLQITLRKNQWDMA